MKIAQVVNIALRRKGYTGTVNEKMYQWLYDVTGATGKKTLNELWQDFAAQTGEHFNEYDTVAELKADKPEAGTIAMAKDSPHLWVYENGKWEQSAPDPKVGGVPVGSIQSTILAESEFRLANPDDAGKPVEQQTWLLCDGRNCRGTAYATLTGKHSVPDLRGAYLRMGGANGDADHWINGGNLGDIQDCKTRHPDKPFTATTNNAGHHNHDVSEDVKGGHVHGMDSTGNHYHSLGEYEQEASDMIQQYHMYTAANPSPMTGHMRRLEDPFSGGNSAEGNEKEMATSTDGNHTHTLKDAGEHIHNTALTPCPNHNHSVRTNAGGDDETRPQSVVINYYIKVN